MYKVYITVRAQAHSLPPPAGSGCPAEGQLCQLGCIRHTQTLTRICRAQRRRNWMTADVWNVASKRKTERMGSFSLERRDTAAKEEMSLSFFVDSVIGSNQKWNLATRKKFLAASKEMCWGALQGSKKSSAQAWKNRLGKCLMGMVVAYLVLPWPAGWQQSLSNPSQPVSIHW